MKQHQYRQNTINRICIVWSPNHDEFILPEIGHSGSIDAYWPLSSSPPQGNPLSGFNIRSQSRPQEGFIYIDFDNVPYFWRHDVNPSAIPWNLQYSAVLETLQFLEIDTKDIEDFESDCKNRPRDIKLPLYLLKHFAVQLGNILKQTI